MADSEIRIGKVSSVDYESGMGRVTYRDKDESVTMSLPMINYNDEYRMPEPGQDVIVAHLSNGSSRAVLLGTVWNKKNIPAESGDKLYRKELSREKDAAYVRYSDETGEYLVKAANVHINGVNETILDGPRVEVAANLSILWQTEKMQMDLSELEIANSDADQVSAEIKTDIRIDQEGNALETVILKALFDFVEDLKVQTGMGIAVTAEDEIEVTAGTDVRVSGGSSVDISAGGTLRLTDGRHSITLAEIMERLGEK